MLDKATLIEELREKKDLLRLRVHLGSMEARSQWDALEAKWRLFVEESGLRETSKDVGRQLAEELRKGYTKLEAALASARPGTDGEERRRTAEELAYRLWEERGRPVGTPEEDWLRAEEMLAREEAASVDR